MSVSAIHTYHSTAAIFVYPKTNGTIGMQRTPAAMLGGVSSQPIYEQMSLDGSTSMIKQLL
jgi:hypothetical protein